MALSKYTLSLGEAEQIELSNDAFFYICQEEEMLDEDNMAEAIELQERYPLGFKVEDWYYGDEPGTIIAVIKPYIDTPPDNSNYTYELDELGGWFFQFDLFNDGNNPYVVGRNYNKKTGKIMNDGKWPVTYYHKKPWAIITTPNGKTEIPIFKAL